MRLQKKRRYGNTYIAKHLFVPLMQLNNKLKSNIQKVVQNLTKKQTLIIFITLQNDLRKRQQC